MTVTEAIESESVLHLLDCVNGFNAPGESCMYVCVCVFVMRLFAGFKYIILHSSIYALEKFEC